MAEAEALFNQIDEDQSGELSLLELQTHLADLGFTDVDAEQLLFDLDTNKNGQVLLALLVRKHCAHSVGEGKATLMECVVDMPRGVCGWSSAVQATGRLHGKDRHPATGGGQSPFKPYGVAPECFRIGRFV